MKGEDNLPENEYYSEDDILQQLYSNFELMLLAVYSNGLESGQSLENLDNMDFIYFIDILIYRKFNKKEDGEYIDNLIL